MDLTQQELAEALDISRQTLSNLEKGQYLPSFGLILDLEDFFRLPIRKIFNKNINNQSASRRKGGKMKESFLPFQNLDQLYREFDQMFKSPFGSSFGSFFPSVNLYQDSSDLIIEVEVPGMDKDDIEINLTENSATISGEKKESQEIKNDNYLRRESSFGKFSRTIDLPAKINDSKAKATIKNGRLKIVAPLKKPFSKKKGLEIKEE